MILSHCIFMIWQHCMQRCKKKKITSKVKSIQTIPTLSWVKFGTQIYACGQVIEIYRHFCTLPCLYHFYRLKQTARKVKTFMYSCVYYLIPSKKRKILKQATSAWEKRFPCCVSQHNQWKAQCPPGLASLWAPAEEN